jgi:hypothetical protein
LADDDDDEWVTDDEWCIVTWCRLVEDVDGLPSGVYVSEEQIFVAPPVLERIRRQTKRRRRSDRE